jgi:hypothetical protein
MPLKTGKSGLAVSGCGVRHADWVRRLPHQGVLAALAHDLRFAVTQAGSPPGSCCKTPMVDRSSGFFYA